MIINPEKDTICIYHAKCFDGFGSAYVVWRFFNYVMRVNNIEFLPANYGDEIPDVKDKNVIIVDFSYPVEGIKKIIDESYSTILLDHHKTALENFNELNSIGNLFEENNCYINFDMDESGVSLTWNYFFPDTKFPLVLLHIKDRDLWNFNDSRTKHFMYFLGSKPFDFDIWDEIILDCEIDEYQYLEMLCDGKAIERKFFIDCERLLETVHFLNIDNFSVPAINAPFMFASELGNKLAKTNIFSAVYFFDGIDYKFSLRSSKDGGIDVSEIAKKYGGGGHKHASGFSIKAEQLQYFYGVK